MIYCTHDRFQRPLGMTLPCLWAWHVEFHSSIHRKELVKGSAWARLIPRGASPAVKGTSIEDIAQVVGKSGRRETGRGPLFWRSERCSPTVEPYEKRVKKECALCLP